MNCPICENPNAVEITENADIGVGVIVITVGMECPQCGQIPACRFCGQIMGHSELCEAVQKTKEEWHGGQS